MFRKKKWTLVSLLSGLALIAAITGFWLFGNTSIANAAEVRANDLRTLTQSSTGPGLLGEGYLAQGGWGRGGLRGIDYQKLLADALGITVEQLQAAYETARTAAIEQAVEEGLITREQADEMLVWGGLGRKGFDFMHFRRAPKGVTSTTIDEEALLANALGITVDQLQAAREKANQAAIELAVKEGIITQEQADQMLARKKLQDYLNQDTLLAKALGLTVEELKAAYAKGETLSTLMKQKGLDAATVRARLTTAYEEALAQAVKDGVITQEQADEMQNAPGWGLGFPGDRMMGPGGHWGFRGPGGFRGRGPCAPDTDEDNDGENSGGANYRLPGRGIRAGGAL